MAHNLTNPSSHIVSTGRGKDERLMEKLIIEIKIEGDALETDYHDEIGYILRNVTEKLTLGSLASIIQDSNGNSVGHFRFEKRGL